MRRLISLMMFAVPAFAGGGQAADFDQTIQPILAQHCVRCHGPAKSESRLRLDSKAGILAEGEHGPIIAPHEPSKSSLLIRVRSMGTDRMPPEDEGKRLTDGEITAIEQWIVAGAPGIKDKTTSDPKSFWSYRPPTHPPVPVSTGNPIDAFLDSARQKVGVKTVEETTPRLLLRRAYLDLIGIPPSEEELSRFETDSSPPAFERVVDDLLARPEYGQRWARHWMDIWRYSDWYGFREMKLHFGSRRHIWRWRDWIVDSLNKDVGYDRMIQDMLSADEIAPGDVDRARATGYLGRNYYAFS